MVEQKPGRSGTAATKTAAPGVDGTYALAKVVGSAVEALALYRKAIPEAQQAGLDEVVQFLRDAQGEDRERVRRGFEVISGLMDANFW